MTEGRHKEIEDFCLKLSEKRTQVDDRALLDQCQVYLTELLELSKDNSLEPDPKPAQAGAAQ